MNYLIFTLFLLYIIFYIHYNSLNDIISKYIEMSAIEQIEIIIFSTNVSRGLFRIDEKTKVENIISNISKIDVKFSIKPIFPFWSKFKSHDIYSIVLLTDNDLVKIDFIGKRYLMINGITYKIVDTCQLRWFGDIVNLNL